MQVNRLFSILAIAVIRFYRYFMSPLTPRPVGFNQLAQHMIEAIEQHV